MKIIGTLALLACAACSAPPVVARGAEGAYVAIMRSMPDGSGIFFSRLGGEWRFVAKGTDPALSPDGRLLAYTAVVKTGTEEGRRIRVVDMTTGRSSSPTEVPGGSEQYGAVWAPNSGFLYFHVFYPKENARWTIGRFSYPTFEYSRVGDFPPGVPPPSASADGRFSLANDIVRGYPSFAHDGPYGLFLVEHPTLERTLLTPPGFLIGDNSCWLRSTNEILFVGIWHPDSDRATWHVYRINPFERNWATVPEADWTHKRITEGQQVSCSRQ